MTCKAEKGCTHTATHAAFVRDNTWPEGKRIRVPACETHGRRTVLEAAVKANHAAWLLPFTGGLKGKQVN